MQFDSFSACSSHTYRIDFSPSVARFQRVVHVSICCQLSEVWVVDVNIGSISIRARTIICLLETNLSFDAASGAKALAEEKRMEQVQDPSSSFSMNYSRMSESPPRFGKPTKVGEEPHGSPVQGVPLRHAPVVKAHLGSLVKP